MRHACTACHAKSNPGPGKSHARRVNVRRGMFRAWLVFSALWAPCFLGLSAPIWYHAASYWLHTQGIQITKETNSKTLGCSDINKECLSVKSPKGCRYFMIVDRRVYTVSMAAAWVAELEHTSHCAHPTTGGYGNDPIVIDLTASDGGTGLAPLPNLGDYPDTGT